MKTYFSFFSICCFVIGNVYAAQEKGGNSIDLIKQQESKPVYKISKRKILKTQPPEEEEVSSFSMEELRLGAQKPLDKSEIEYFKSQCRYAFMSDRDVIVNRCETKKVSLPK